MATIYLIDGSGYIFRAFYAIRHLTNAHGLPTNAVFGYTQMLRNFLKAGHAEHAAVVFDSKGPNFRHEMFPDYKANRSEPPDELIPQFPFFQPMAQALGLPIFSQSGMEADDIIATIATRMRAAGHDVVIITGDKDFMQLVDDHITLWDTMKEKTTDRAGVRARFGVDPAQVVDVQALAGDAVDNVKGVPGIGEKTAMKLIAEYGSLDAVLQHAPQIKGKVGEKLVAHAADAHLAKKLCTLKTDVVLAADLDDLRVRSPDVVQLRALCTELGFANLLQEFAPDAQATLNKNNYRLITTADDLQKLAARMREVGTWAIDTETIGLNPRHAALVGISVAVAAGEACYIPLAHCEPLFGMLLDGQLSLAVVQEILGPVLADATQRAIVHHAKFDLPILARHGLPIATVEYDTMIAAYLLEPGSGIGLDALALRYLNHRMIAFAEVVNPKTGRENFAMVPLDEACAYAAEDADATLQLAQILKPQLTAAGLDQVLRAIELPLVPILLAMETTGFLIDATLLKNLSTEFRERLRGIEQEIYVLAGAEFNIASPKQLGVILFDKLQLTARKRTKTGYSTSADVLETLAAEHPLPQRILDYRSLAKLLSTYIDALPTMIDATTMRVHTEFNQTNTATGRLSSSDPNLQNIPIRSAEGRMIRRAFIAPPDCVLLAADYSQIELRILAHLSGDERLCAAFGCERDVHAETAAEIFSVPLASVTSEQRAVGKTVNFGVVYGQTAYGLAGQLKIAPDVAKAYIERYFALYPAVAAYREAVLAAARESGVVHTLYGRRRVLTELQSPQLQVRANAERMAFNAVVQGTAADVIKLAMMAIDARLRTAGHATRMLLQVHDELIFEVPHADVERIQVLVQECMMQVAPPTGTFRVPLNVSIGVGANWAACGE